MYLINEVALKLASNNWASLLPSSLVEGVLAAGLVLDPYPETIGTFSTKVFSGNLKRQTARSHVTKRCGHVWSSQRGFLTPRSRFSRK